MNKFNTISITDFSGVIKEQIFVCNFSGDLKKIAFHLLVVTNKNDNTIQITNFKC